MQTSFGGGSGIRDADLFAPVQNVEHFARRWQVTESDMNAALL